MVLEKTDCLKIAMLSEGDLIREQVSKFENELNMLPEGKISRKMISGKTYYYQYQRIENGKYNQKYLGKDGKLVVENLKRKVFLQRSLRILKQNLSQIDLFIGKYKPYFPSEILEDMLIPSEKRVELIHCDDLIIKNWMLESYEKGKFFQEDVIQTTMGGLNVRSKSEAIIAGILEQKGIPFRYEAKLVLGEREFYPDFTLLRPRDGKIIYWEHFGMLKDEEYQQRANRKLKIYYKNGLNPWDNLIVTNDGFNGSINANLILKIIKFFIES